MKITNQLFNIKDFVKHSPIYVETGTCTGESLKRALLAGYKQCYTVELKKEFYEETRVRYQNYPVEFFHGKSIDLLPLMLSRAEERAVIFLDAHPAGPNTAGHYELKSGDNSYGQHQTIMTELFHILKHRPDHLIIIDDQHGPDDDNFEYVKRCVDQNLNYKFYFYDEQLEDGILHKNKIMVCNPL